MAQLVEELLHTLWKSRVGFPIGFPDFINNSCLTMVLVSTQALTKHYWTHIALCSTNTGSDRLLIDLDTQKRTAGSKWFSYKK